MDFHCFATPRQIRCHPDFLLVKMLVKVLPTLQCGDFTSMGKLTDTKLRSMKPTTDPWKIPGRQFAEARRKCLEARQVLADGRDPGEVKKSEREAALLAEKEKALTFEVVAEQWFEKHATERVKSMAKYLIPPPE